MARRGTAPLLRFLALALLACRFAAALKMIIPPGEKDCMRQLLTPAHLRPGTKLPPNHEGRASLIVAGIGRKPHPDSLGAKRNPSVKVSILGPGNQVLYDKFYDSTMRDDIVFTGVGMGAYQLCLSTPPGMPITVGVELNYFAPYTEAVDPDALRPAGEEKDAAAVAEDVAQAEGAVARMRAELRRLKTDQAHLKKRQIRHQKTLSSSDRRAVVWTSLEVVALGGLSALQMVLFRRAFRNY